MNSTTHSELTLTFTSLDLLPCQFSSSPLPPRALLYFPSPPSHYSPTDPCLSSQVAILSLLCLYSCHSPSTHVSFLSYSLPTQILSPHKLLVSSYLQCCDKTKNGTGSRKGPLILAPGQPLRAILSPG